VSGGWDDKPQQAHLDPNYRHRPGVRACLQPPEFLIQTCPGYCRVDPQGGIFTWLPVEFPGGVTYSFVLFPVGRQPFITMIRINGRNPFSYLVPIKEYYDMAENSIETKDTEWKSIFRIGGISALIVTAFFLIDMIVLVACGPYPQTANGWFVLLQNKRIVGVLSLDIFVLAGFPFCYPIFFALYGALRQVNKTHLMLALATVLAFAGLAIVISTDKTYSMISLSNQFAAATTEAQKSLLLAAGETILSTSSGTGAVMASFFLEGAAFMISIIMLRSGIFGRFTSCMGIVGHGLDLTRIVINLVFGPIAGLAWVSTIGFILLAIGGPLQLIWYALIGRRLLQLGRR
jgi:hypothetical protein